MGRVKIDVNNEKRDDDDSEEERQNVEVEEKRGQTLSSGK